MLFFLVFLLPEEGPSCHAGSALVRIWALFLGREVADADLGRAAKTGF